MTKLYNVSLTLGRMEGFPEGSSEHGYTFIAPLTADGHIDPAAWREFKDKCLVTRFWGEAPIEHGRLRHVGQGWRFDYDARTSEDDEPFFKLGKHVIRPGNYISITEHDGVQRPFRVADVQPVSGGENL